jgi:hypothetical protein
MVNEHQELKLAELQNVEARELLVLLWALSWSMRYFRASVESGGEAGYKPRNGMKALDAERRMAVHIASIMLMLARVNAPYTVQLAGAVHDVIEWHPQGADPLNVKLALYQRELAGFTGHPLNGQLVPLVHRLIEAVCEPPKQAAEDERAWRNRKWMYVASLEVADDDATLLSIVTKIHGLMELVHILADGGRTEDWSKVGREPNVEFFRALLVLYDRRRMPEVLLDVFRHLLRVFIGFGR